LSLFSQKNRNYSIFFSNSLLTFNRWTLSDFKLDDNGVSFIIPIIQLDVPVYHKTTDFLPHL